MAPNGPEPSRSHSRRALRRAELLSGALAAGLLLACISDSARAEWSPYGGALATSGADQVYAMAVTDGAGGAIVAWRDHRTADQAVYAQRVDAWGRTLWAPGGVPVCTAPGYQYINAILADGSGGAIIVWNDDRSGAADIYAQKVDASGVPQWLVDGVAVCSAPNFQWIPMPEIAPDGAGGAIIAWEDYRGAFVGVYARRIDATGTPLWTSDGVALGGPLTAHRYQPVIAADGLGGAVVSWYDYRNGTADIYAQRLNAAGANVWNASGVAVCTATNEQYIGGVVSDGAGGALLAWTDNRWGGSDIYAQRVGASGATAWTVDGIGVCTEGNLQAGVTIAADGNGGAVLGWTDYRSGLPDIYAQRVDVAGGLLWAASGVAVCNAANYQSGPRIQSDGDNGAILVWMDQRTGSADLYSQRIDSGGLAHWTANGTPVSNGAGSETLYSITSDGAGHVIAVWNEYRGGLTSAAFAQRMEPDFGAWGHPEPEVVSVADVPNDQGGVVAVNWKASARDLPTPRTIGSYSIWRAVDALPGAEEGRVLHSVADLPLAGLRGSEPMFAASTVPGYYWELVGAQPAQGWPAYSFTTPTRADSVDGDPATEFFMVAAHDLLDDYVAFASNAGVGHSSDNLAPAPPLMLLAERNGPDVHLRWNRVAAPDLRDYAVYRGDLPGVDPGSAVLVASATDTTLVDANAPGSALFYVVTALDVHENRSTPSNEANVGATTDAAGLAGSGRLEVLPNRPNPFATTTQFEISLPSRSDVVVDIYDVAGRAVRRLVSSGRGPGWVRIPFDGRDEAGRPLASGVGFYRVTAGGTTVTRKLVIAR